MKEVKDVMASGATGLAIGRNVWQHPKPLELTKKIQKIVFSTN